MSEGPAVEHPSHYFGKDLLPCPFCANKAEYFQSHKRTIGHGETGDTVGVQCSACKVHIGHDSYSDCEVIQRRQKAARTWNNREPMPEATIRLAKAESLLSRIDDVYENPMRLNGEHAHDVMDEINNYLGDYSVPKHNEQD